MKLPINDDEILKAENSIKSREPFGIKFDFKFEDKFYHVSVYSSVISNFDKYMKKTWSEPYIIHFNFDYGKAQNTFIGGSNYASDVKEVIGNLKESIADLLPKKYVSYLNEEPEQISFF